MKKTRPPILPRDFRDPTGADALERQAIREFGRRMRKVGRAYISALGRIPSELAINKKYTFRFDRLLLAAILHQLDIEVDGILLEGGSNEHWFFGQYVAVAAQRGVAQAFANMAYQSPAYKAGRGGVNVILGSEPYLRRLGIQQARSYEEMKGLTSKAKANMGRVLTEGIARGLNPREVARSLTDQAGIEAKRASKIARTEITTTLRRARWDEAEDARDFYGFRNKLMHLSALSATTRKSHAQRHAKLFSFDEVRSWYAQDGNSINCKCSQVEVMVDENDKPISEGIQARARSTLEKMKARQYAWAKD